MKSTICLNMIVKNESHIIIKTLENLCSYIQFSYWVIYDTGSTDNTKELITDFFKIKQIDGELMDHEWIDFGYNRTKALECAYNKTDMLFIFDADDEIIGDFVLPDIYDCDLYKCKFGSDFVYYRPLLINNRRKWYFKGVLHEFLVNRDDVHGAKNIEGNYYLVSGRSGNRSKNPNKYIDDAIILKKAHFDESGTDYSLSCRYAFYCAQSYKDAGSEYIEDAIEWYKKCLDLKMWDQEKYHSCVSMGELYMKKNDTENALKYWYKTIEYDNERVEGIINAVNYLRNSGQHLLVNALYYKFKDYSKKQLDNKLFLFKSMYHDELEYNNAISAFYVNDKISGYECCKKIFINKILSYNLLKLTISNFKFYIDFIDKDTVECALQLFYAFDEVIHMISLNNEQIDDNMVTIWTKLFEKNRPLLTKFYYYSFENKPKPQIFISFTTCKRLDLFKQTIYSMLNHWLDIDKIDYWFCVDDNSSDEDRKEMKSRFSWFDFYMKPQEEKGHRKSMNIIWNKLNELKPTYWIHMEDDFLFYNKMNYIEEAINGLQKLQKYGNVKQILFNRNYGETIQNYNNRGHVVIDKINDKFVLHNYNNIDKFNYMNCHYWPHYSFRPSLIDTKVILELGNFDSLNQFFEIDYAKKWTNAGFKSAFFNIITNQHIGRLTSDRNTKVIKNAYELNNENQFNNPQMNNDFMISLTSIPRRFSTSLPIVIKSILNQSMKCKIILNIPYEYSKWDTVEIPDEIKNNKDIILNRTTIDYGPATKLLGAIDYINKMNLSVKYVITIDDDIEYTNTDYFQIIKQTVAKYPDHVISIASINLSHYPYSYENGLSYDNLGYVDIPRGYCGVSYPVYLFKKSTYLSRDFFNTLPIGIFNEDDTYFGILMSILNIPIFVENNKKHIKLIESAGMSAVCEKTTVDRITNEMNIIQFAINNGYLPNKFSKSC